MPHSIMRVDVAGRDVTRYLRLLLRKEGVNFRTTAEFEIVRQIKVLNYYQSALPSDQDLGFLPNANLDPDLFRTEFVKKLADFKFLCIAVCGHFSACTVPLFSII
jgi:hypothetical protein